MYEEHGTNLKLDMHIICEWKTHALTTITLEFWAKITWNFNPIASLDMLPLSQVAHSCNRFTSSQTSRKHASSWTHVHFEGAVIRAQYGGQESQVQPTTMIDFITFLTSVEATKTKVNVQVYLKLKGFHARGKMPCWWEQFKIHTWILHFISQSKNYT